MLIGPTSDNEIAITVNLSVVGVPSVRAAAVAFDLVKDLGAKALGAELLEMSTLDAEVTIIQESCCHYN